MSWQKTKKKISSGIFFPGLAINATFLSDVWAIWDDDNTPENTAGFEVLLLHMPLCKWYSTVIIPQLQNNFPSHRDKVCVLWHMHSGSWVNIGINMRSRNEILILRYEDNALIQREVKPVLSSENMDVDKYCQRGSGAIFFLQYTVRQKQMEDQQGRFVFLLSV